MGSGIVQASFTSGELAPSLYGRVDFASYYTGLKTCRNFIVRPFGGVTNRPGTQFITEILDSTRKARLIPFEFSTTQAYILVFGHYTMQVIMNGGVVMNGSVPVQVATIWGENDLPLLKFTQSADVMTICHPLYPPQQLSRTSHTAWTLSAFNNVNGPFQDINIDTSMTLSVSAMTGSVTITSVNDLFLAGHVGMMMYLEAAPDDRVLKWEVQKAIMVNDIRRGGSSYYQALNSGTTGTVRPTCMEGSESDGDPGVKWSYLHSGSGIILITGVTSSKIATGTVLSRLPDSTVTGTMSRTITGATAGYPPVDDGTGTGTYSLPVNAKIVCPAHGFSTGDSVTISGIVGMSGINGTAQIIADDVNNFELSGVYGSGSYGGGGVAAKTLTAQPTYKWAFESWGIVPAYPGSVAYIQQRQCFAGSPTKPQSFWMSRSAGFTDFGTSVPLLDDDALSVTLNSRKANEIRHFVELTDLILLTSDGPFRVSGGTDGVLAPGKTICKKQGASGCSHVPPIVINNVALYIQEKGSQVRSLGYSWQADSFVGQDLTLMSSHLFYQHTIKEWCFQAVPFSCAWAVREDGALLGFTYMPDQQVAGWHRHDTDGLFESVACISEGNEDVVYFLVNRTINGVSKRYVERMNTRYFETMADAYFVDCGLSYDGRNAGTTTISITGGVNWDEKETLTLVSSSALFQAGDLGDLIAFTYGDKVYRLKIIVFTDTQHVQVIANCMLPTAYQDTARTDWAFARNTMAGLNHLEGNTVDILADGFALGQQVVTGGVVTLPYPGAVVHIGLPIVSDFETLDIASSQNDIRDKKKLINHISLIVEESMGVLAGPDVNHLTEYKQERLSYDQVATSASGIMDMRVQATWNKAGRMFVRQARPLPITILTVIPEVSAGGS